MNQPDSPEYLERKKHFARLLQIFGRQPVLEILQQSDLRIERIHLAKGSRGKILKDILELARKRRIEVVECSAARVSQISRKAKQDQGIVADVSLPGHQLADDFLKDLPRSFRLLAIDRVTTPANVGMIIRSLAASAFDGMILPSIGTCGLNAMVIKASAGTVFRTNILRCKTLKPVLEKFLQQQTRLVLLEASANKSLYAHQPAAREIYLMGGETDGVSPELLDLKHSSLSIPMHNGVESLNVAVASALVAFEISRKLG